MCLKPSKSYFSKQTFHHSVPQCNGHQLNPKNSQVHRCVPSDKNGKQRENKRKFAGVTVGVG